MTEAWQGCPMLVPLGVLNGHLPHIGRRHRPLGAVLTNCGTPGPLGQIYRTPGAALHQESRGCLFFQAPLTGSAQPEIATEGTAPVIKC